MLKPAGIIVALGGLALWFVASHSNRTPPAPEPRLLPHPAAEVAAVQPPPAPSEDLDAAPPAVPAVPAGRRDPRTAGSPLAAELNSQSGTGAEDVRALHGLLRHYLVHLGRRQGLPIGNDSDLARVLTGQNPMKLVLLPPGHPALGPDGRLRDRWGTPYFIHPRGRNAFEIRSAGPDRKLFTADDFIENPPPGGLSQGESSAK